jgi:hypothetical protein
MSYELEPVDDTTINYQTGFRIVENGKPWVEQLFTYHSTRPYVPPTCREIMARLRARLAEHGIGASADGVESVSISVGREQLLLAQTYAAMAVFELLGPAVALAKAKGANTAEVEKLIQQFDAKKALADGIAIGQKHLAGA